MSEQVFNKLKLEIEKKYPAWCFNQRGDRNWSLSNNNKVFAYFDYVRGGNVIIRARIYPNNENLKEFSNSWNISDRVGKIGSWKDEVINIPLLDISKINDYLSLLEITAFGKKSSSSVKVSQISPAFIEKNDLKEISFKETVTKLESIYQSSPVVIKNINTNENINIQNTIKNNSNQTLSSEKIENKNISSHKEILDFIYPIAKSYHSATQGYKNLNKKLHSYFKFVEVVSTFNSITLLSALALEQNYIREYEQKIWNKNENSLSRLSMGAWIDLYRKLSNIFKEINRKDTSFLSRLPFSSDFYFSLIDKKLLEILEYIPPIRNRIIHCGDTPPDAVLKNYIQELDPFLEELFNKLSFLKNIDLIFPTSMKKTSVIYEIDIKLLNGAISEPFTEDSITLDQALETDTLYLYKKESKEKIKLLPEFINLHDCSECNHLSLFIYDKIKEIKNEKKACYYSLHNVEHYHYLSINGLLNVFT